MISPPPLLTPSLYHIPSHIRPRMHHSEHPHDKIPKHHDHTPLLGSHLSAFSYSLSPQSHGPLSPPSPLLSSPSEQWEWARWRDTVWITRGKQPLYEDTHTHTHTHTRTHKIEQQKHHIRAWEQSPLYSANQIHLASPPANRTPLHRRQNGTFQSRSDCRPAVL